MKQFKITHFLSFLFLFVLLATTLSSCKSTSVVPPATIETKDTITIKEVIRDTVFEIQKDSSYYKAYLDCVNGKVVISPKSKVESRKGGFVQIPKVDLKDNILTIDCKVEAQKLFAQWKDTYTKEHKSTIQKIPYPVEKQLSTWQKSQIILGRIFLGLLVLIAIAVGLRITKVI